MITPEKFAEWHKNLRALDRMNFDTLIRLPGGRDVLKEMGDCEYRDMGIFILDEGKKLAKKVLGLDDSTD